MAACLPLLDIPGQFYNVNIVWKLSFSEKTKLKWRKVKAALANEVSQGKLNFRDEGKKLEV